VNALLAGVGDALGSEVLRLTKLRGGDINDAYRAQLANGESVFVKTRAGAPSGMYAREAEGLAWLRDAHALRIPDVRGWGDAWLALEWIAPAAQGTDFDVRLGRGLATLHRAGATQFGLATDNFIGPLPQPNQARASWAEFYAEQRLLPVLRRASDRGLVDAPMRRGFEQLLRTLPERVGPSEPPARLHGDLWSGNVHVDEHGAPVLIDPAVYGGHREVDLAMLRLFGAPSQAFFAAYDEIYPRASGHEERVPLYQLYPLLVHLCLFGGGYAGALSRALQEARLE
jgi:fructosamine-3-kinase